MCSGGVHSHEQVVLLGNFWWCSDLSKIFLLPAWGLSTNKMVFDAVLDLNEQKIYIGLSPFPVKVAN